MNKNEFNDATTRAEKRFYLEKELRQLDNRADELMDEIDGLSHASERDQLENLEGELKDTELAILEVKLDLELIDFETYKTLRRMKGARHD